MKEAPSAGTDGLRPGNSKPPASAERLLLLLLPEEVGEAVAGDLREVFETVVLPGSGTPGAKLWYWRQALYAARLGLRFRRNPQSALALWKGQIRMENPRTASAVYHPGISIHNIPIRGRMGLLFVLGTLYIFGMGIPAVRTLGTITAAFGVIGAALLYMWHRRHSLKICSLELHKPPPSTRPSGAKN